MSGLSEIREIAKQKQAARASSSDSERRYTKYLKVADGGFAVVRFLEQGDEVMWRYTHKFKPDNYRYPATYTCLDHFEEGKRCPFCESDLVQQIGTQKITVAYRSVTGWINLIWRDAPKQEKQGDKWVTIGYEDQLAVWSSGIKVFEELDTIDVNYKGLRSRDFRIFRRGASLQTEYTIMPAEVDAGPQPMSPADEALAKDKYDLKVLAAPLEVDAAYKLLAGEGSGGVTSDTVSQQSAFARRSGNIFAQ